MDERYLTPFDSATEGSANFAELTLLWVLSPFMVVNTEGLDLSEYSYLARRSLLLEQEGPCMALGGLQILERQRMSSSRLRSSCRFSG